MYIYIYCQTLLVSATGQSLFDPVDRPRSRPSDFSRGGRAEELHGSALVRGNSIAGLVFGSGLPHKLQGEIHIGSGAPKRGIVIWVIQS